MTRSPPDEPELKNRSPGGGAAKEPPPEGPPWDLPIDEAPFAFVDLEMTGLKVGEDRVVEICIERVRGTPTGDERIEGRLATAVNPGERRGAEHVHGLGDAALSAAPTFADLADRIVALLEGAVFVAHGAPWDLAFLHDELARVGRAADAPTYAIDTIIACRRAFHFGSYGLQNVAKSLSIDVARAHRADDDVRTMRGVFARVCAELAPKTPRDLWEVRVGERVPRTEIVSGVEAAIAAGLPVHVVYRPAHRGPERLQMVLTALVPPHAIGYLLPGRGRRELRIDRILRIETESS